MTKQHRVGNSPRPSAHKPLPGATVLIPARPSAPSPTPRGSYSITVPNGASSLQFNYVGYIPRTERITGNTMNVVMQGGCDESWTTWSSWDTASRINWQAPHRGVRIRGTAASGQKGRTSRFCETSTPGAP
ncbi:MAG: hypothetical protein ACLRMJ_00680 [Alistipes finegoldii]